MKITTLERTYSLLAHYNEQKQNELKQRRKQYKVLHKHIESSFLCSSKMISDELHLYKNVFPLTSEINVL